MLTDDDGRYRFVTIKPGPYPWGNHDKAWRPAHIHFSLFGNVYAQRLVTQMYFPSDPLFDYDPIFQSVPDEAARQRLVSRFSMEQTVGARCSATNSTSSCADATPRRWACKETHHEQANEQDHYLADHRPVLARSLAMGGRRLHPGQPEDHAPTVLVTGIIYDGDGNRSTTPRSKPGRRTAPRRSRSR
jgi:hypothetical protein